MYSIKKSGKLKKTRLFQLTSMVMLLFFSEFYVFAQDPGNLQLFSNSLYVNPGFVGSFSNKKVSLNYRNQWPGNGTKFEDFYASYDQSSDLLHGGFGFYVLNDQAGKVMRNTSLAAIYSYQLQVSKDIFVQAGFQVSGNQRYIRSSGLIFPDMIDLIHGSILPPTEMIGDLKRFFMDYSVGFVGYSKDWFSGISLHHLTQPGLSENKLDETVLPRKLTFFIGRNFEWSVFPGRKDPLVFSPELFFISQSFFYNLKYGIVLGEKPFSLAMHFKHDLSFSYSSMVISLGIDQPNFNLVYSFEVQVGRQSLMMPQSGIHEIGISIYLARPEKKNTHGAIKLPSI